MAASSRARLTLPALLGLLGLLGLLALTPPATAAGRSMLPAPGEPFAAVTRNPANALLGLPLDEWSYDRATRCTPQRRWPGVGRLAAWLRGQTGRRWWGVYRCERWGKDSASLHAEGRAIDWHLDRSRAAQRRLAERTIRRLLAPDRTGQPAALARRMGVQGIIWDCRAWFGGIALRRYGACYTEAGRRRRHVSTTLAHRDHIHLELSLAGARGRTSFWTARP